MKGMTIIVKTIVRLLTPILLLIGAYITLHGHLTPGGGFPGGVVISSAIVLLILAYSLRFPKKRVSLEAGELVKGVGAFMITLVAVVGLVASPYFFKNVGVYPRGWPGLIFSGGDLVLFNIWEAVHVAAAFTIAFYLFTRE